MFYTLPNISHTASGLNMFCYVLKPPACSPDILFILSAVYAYLGLIEYDWSGWVSYLFISIDLSHAWINHVSL